MLWRNCIKSFRQPLGAPPQSSVGIQPVPPHFWILWTRQGARADVQISSHWWVMDAHLKIRASIHLIYCLTSNFKCFIPPCFPPLPLAPRLSSLSRHNDLALKLRILHNNNLSQINLNHVSKVATDISRLRAGHVQAQVWSSPNSVAPVCFNI